MINCMSVWSHGSEPRTLHVGRNGSTTVTIRLSGTDLSLFEGKLLRANCRDVRVAAAAPDPVEGDTRPGITLTILSRAGADAVREILADCLESGASSISLENRPWGVTVVVASSHRDAVECWTTVKSVLWQ